MKNLNATTTLCLLVIVFLSGCQSLPKKIQNESECKGDKCPSIFTDGKYGYSILIPSALSRWTHFSESLNSPSYPSFTTSDDPTSTRLTIFNSSSECSPSITGATETTELLEDGNGSIWGKVNAWDNTNTEGWEMPSNAEQIFCQPIDNTVTYVFCSNKKGKTIVACMNQVNNDSEIAKQVFSTFRWTNEN